MFGMGQIFCCFLVRSKNVIGLLSETSWSWFPPNIYLLLVIPLSLLYHLAQVWWSCPPCVRICPGKESWLVHDLAGARLLHPLLTLLTTGSLHSPDIGLNKHLPVSVLFSNWPAVIYSEYPWSTLGFSTFYICQTDSLCLTYSEVDLLAGWCSLAFVAFLCYPV